MGIFGTDRPELMSKGMVGNFGDRAGKLNAGRAGSNNHKV